MRPASRETIRGFQLVIEPNGSDEFGVRLEQTNGGGSPAKVLASIRPRDIASLMDPLHECLGTSEQSFRHHERSRSGSTRPQGFASLSLWLPWDQSPDGAAEKRSLVAWQP